jgi:glycosyltransferase involved in cell wall biosynthesis
MSEVNTLEKRIGSEVSQTPVVSVIIPAYNAAVSIIETLNSIFSQTYKNYEIVLVNDGSPDSEELEQSLAPYLKKIIYVRQTNGGTAAARNTAIKNASGELLAFLDGDDVWFPAYLESQFEELNTRKCDLIYCDAELFGALRSSKNLYSDKNPSRGAVTAESLIDGTCNIITSGTVVKREKVVSAGMFDEKLPRIGMEDFDLWFRLVTSGAKLDYQKRVLLKYRVSANSLSGSNVQIAERQIKALKIISEKYDLTVSENEKVEKCLEESLAQLEIEKGKYNLTRENYAEARENFEKANAYYRKLNLTVLTKLLKLNPRVARILYQKMRPQDFSFVSPAESNK